jgi:Uma2 family endonuclease
MVKRSEGDYGPKAEEAMAAKRADYFAAGTRVVWDVDLLCDDVVRVYRAGDPNQPTVYRRGEMAEAEPAVPGWIMPVDDLFLQ